MLLARRWRVRALFSYPPGGDDGVLYISLLITSIYVPIRSDAAGSGGGVER